MRLAKLAAAGLASVGLFLAHVPAYAQKTTVTIYTALENDQLGTFKAAIETAVPEVNVQWVRDSTGVITARVLAEKASPRADIILGLAASSLLLFNKEGLLDPYKAAGAARHKPQFQSKDGLFVGMDAFLGVVCYNTVEGKKAGAAAPATYADLLKPRFKGQVVMPHPASSGTGYLIISAWLQSMGEAAAWTFMDGLHENIAVYTHSGSAPCVQAAKGERIIGLGFDMRAAKEKSNGAPIDIVLPKEGVGWDMEASAIMKGTKHGALVRKIMDWTASTDANKLYAKYYALVADPTVKALPPNYPVDAEARMAKVDLQKMANDRAAVLKEWSRRYEAKAAPKKK
ncbi:MAG: putative 2-aminoethylphosphonate ABC transporter substrate-binding protein [Hyphomicrobiaceae bacterium]